MKILFVCLGNICRSPMAEGIMRHLVEQHGLDWQIDSAGTESYHVGEAPDARAIHTGAAHGIDISGQRARKITLADFEKYNKVYALATDVLHEMQPVLRKAVVTAEVQLLMEAVHPGRLASVPDPYFGTDQDFETAFAMIEQACKAIMKQYADEKKV